MSLFCGKCDLYDSVIKINDIEDWTKIQIFQLSDDSEFTEHGWSNEVELSIDSYKDFIPYAAYIPSIRIGCKGTSKYWIGQESYVDQEEREILEWYLSKIKRIYRKCLRNKLDFTKDIIKDYLWCTDDNLISEIFNRVIEHPYSSNIKGLTTSTGRYHRKLLYDEMIKVGYTEEEATEWVYNKRKIW